ncbi:winged helix-turn-helix transcriptional regulator [Pedobacter zeae]|uniref:DNA-binding HxlR family transcriptional regulator n=2 Tax=Pedobacter zeae TaxID=1737356 RepID=A0A7W6KC63_9SPHI|nr:helix-turn-helix domain-containing protein [Pedobacter zeae]MBB4109091.1 DNA-binding HxlR family transcriptional regulator [Pedobacter zeae]
MNLNCGLHVFMHVLNGKWKANLIWNIHSGIKRPGELHRRLSQASRRLLDTQLKELTEIGILSKKILEQKPLKVEYELTELGKSLLPVFEVTARWGEAHRYLLEPAEATV